MKCSECGQEGTHAFNCSKYTFPSGEFTVRKCHECKQPITAHDWRCSKIKTRYYSEREQRKHRQLGTRYHAPLLDDDDPCPVHGGPDAWIDCRPCWERADADDLEGVDL